MNLIEMGHCNREGVSARALYEMLVCSSGRSSKTESKNSGSFHRATVALQCHKKPIVSTLHHVAIWSSTRAFVPFLLFAPAVRGNLYPLRSFDLARHVVAVADVARTKMGALLQVVVS